MSFNLYAGTKGRAQVIAGLRGMAAFPEDNPDVPVPRAIAFNVFPPTGMNDAQARAEIDLIASRINAVTRESRGGHYIASVSFGPVEYSAVAIPRDTGTSPDGVRE